MQKDEHFLGLAQFSLFFIECRQFYRCWRKFSIAMHSMYGIWTMATFNNFLLLFVLIRVPFHGKSFRFAYKENGKEWTRNRTMENRMKVFPNIYCFAIKMIMKLALPPAPYSMRQWNMHSEMIVSCLLRLHYYDHNKIKRTDAPLSCCKHSYLRSPIVGIL